MDRRKKSIVKAISWRIIASLTTMLLVLIFTHELSLTLEVGALDVIFKLMFYYAHERTWNRISWGSHRN